MEEAATLCMTQHCTPEASDSAYWSCLNVSTPTCLPSPMSSRHNANPSFFSSLTPPPVTPARRCDFAAIGDGEEWNLGDDREDSLDDGEMCLESPDDDSVMPWSKAGAYKPFLSRGRLFASTHAVESACSPEDMSCATTADGASDGCNAADTFDWADLRSGYIQPLRVASAPPPPMPTVAEECGPMLVTRSGRKVKPKRLSLSPPLRALSAPAPPPLLLLPTSRTISKKAHKHTLPALLGLGIEGEEQHHDQVPRPLAAGSAGVAHSMDRSDSSSSVLPLPGCKCRKNGCLRRYCSCFAQSKPCGPDCGCSGCKNDGTLRTPFKAAVAKITKKNPQAFEPKFVECMETGGSVAKTGGGCSCKASNCLKRYCQCFAAGAACSSGCKCSTCHNKGP